MAQGPEVIMVVEGTEQHPRHGGVSMIERKDGSIFMAWMEYTKDNLDHPPAGDDAPADIKSMVSRDGGKTWGEYQTLIKRGPNDTAAYKPSFLRLPNGDICFRYEMYHRFVQGEDPCVSAYLCWSRDECKTFSDPVTIFSRSAHISGSSGDVRQLSTGRIVVPVCYMTGKALQDDGKGKNLAPTNNSVAGSFYSDDDGKTWAECDSYLYLPMRGAMEPKIEELKDGRILMVMRTQLGSVFKSYSENGGQSWSNPQTTGLKSPESCPNLIRIPQTGDLMLTWNHSPYDPKFDHYGLRNPLSVAISKDDGSTWEKGKNVDVDSEWEFTNPTALATSQDTILIAYEAAKYENLVHPGKLGRTLMSFKLAIVNIDWLYE